MNKIIQRPNAGGQIMHRPLQGPTHSYGFSFLAPLHEFFANIEGWRVFVVAALLGALTVFAFAPFHLTPLLIVSFTGLVWMLDGGRGHEKWGRAMFYRCWAFGFGFILVGMHWTAEPFLVDPSRFIWFIWMPTLLLPAGMALIWGMVGIFAGTFWSASPSRIYVFTLFFALAELVRGTLFGGFPWNLIGTSWIPGGAMSQSASIGGVYWLTLLTVFMMAAPAALNDGRNKHDFKWRAMPVVMSLIIVLAAGAWGFMRLQAPTQFTERTVTLMDIGVPQADRFTSPAEWQVDRYMELLDAPEADADIIIWPEGALPIRLLEYSTLLSSIGTKLGPRILIAGTVRQRIPQEGPALNYNSLIVLDDSAGLVKYRALYDKFRLVPFGELPAARIIPLGWAISEILPPTTQALARQGFTPGNGPKVIYPDIEDFPPFVAMICYEGMFPEVPFEANRAVRADWMVIISADGWFGGWIGPAQHYAQNRYRSIEAGLPTARVAGRGVSAMIDGYGREVIRATPAAGDPEGWRSSIGRSAIPAAVESTLFSSFGSAFYWFTIALFGLLAFMFWRS